MPADPAPARAAARGTRLRCAVHPGRPGLDACPVCGRARCAADVAAHGPAGCAACTGHPSSAGASADPDPARLLAGLNAGLLVALAAGAVSTDYVGASGFDLAAPFLGGVAVGLVTTVVAGTRGRGRWDWPLRAAAAALAVLGCALSFRLVPGGLSPFGPVHRVLPAYVAAVGGGLASRLLR